MSDEPPKEPAGIKLGDLTKLIKDTVAEVVGSNNGGTKEPASDENVKDTGIAAQVREAIESIRGEEEKKKKEQTIESELAELKEKTKEKAPVERNRLHKFMGWGENAD